MNKLFGAVRTNSKTKFYFLFIPVIKIKFSEVRKKIYLFGVYICTIKIKNEPKIFNISDEKIIIYFDHSLGGGTENYSNIKIKELKENNVIFRIQYFNMNYYKLTILSKSISIELMFDTIDEIIDILFEFPERDIIVNNLVGYTGIDFILKSISQLKSGTNKVIAMGHDYYGICPSFNLLDKNGDYCNIPENDTCKNCYKDNPFMEKSFKTSAFNAESWKEMWADFYINIVDELIVFSNSSKEIFSKAYSEIQNKIKVIPHITPEFKNQKIPVLKQKSIDEPINIGVIGSIGYQKGKEILVAINNLINNNPKLSEKVKIVVIGDFDIKNEITVTGRYERDLLPQIIQENEIDVIFISSVCPETYSYTTSEAILLNMPVACFNIGAPPERIKLYEKGLILSKIDPEIALEEIIQFVKMKRHNN